MSQEQTLLMLCVAFILIHAWEVRSKRDKILCTIRLNNKTKIRKWAKVIDDHVYFGNWQFNIVKRFITDEWFSGGLTCWLAPMRISTLDYDESSEDPLDPDNLEANHVITPRIRKVINNRDRMAAFAQGVANQSGKKKGGFADFLPWLTLIAVAGIGYMWYQDHQANLALFNQVQQIQATLKSIVK